jgi:hypothetical protein
MSIPVASAKLLRREQARLKARLLAVAIFVTVLAVLHFLDHAARGKRVRDLGLDPNWDHSGWPFTPAFTPFSISLILVAAVLLGGICLTALDRAWAGYWLLAALILAAVVTQVHLVPGEHQESPSVIYRSWIGQPVVGGLAVTDTLLIILSLLVMAANAIQVGRHSRQWWRVPAAESIDPTRSR